VTSLSDRLAWVAALIIAAGVAAVTVRYNSFIPWGTDSGAYVNAAHRWAEGQLFEAAPLGFRFRWASDPYVSTPHGNRPGVKGTFTSIYPLGYPVLLAAALKLGGPLAPYVVAPLCAGLLAWCAFLLARELSTPWAGVVAALLIAASPVTLAHVVMVMSDVPSTAFWALAWVLSLRGGLGAAASSGLATAVAVMIRPNLAPLAVFIFVSLVLSHWRGFAQAWPRGVTFGVTSAVGPALVLWSQAVLYGGALVSGYPASLDYFFSVDRIPQNAPLYPALFTQLHTALPALGLLALPLVVKRSHGDGKRARLVAFTAAGIIVVNYALYLAYLTFDHWLYLRFMLPAMLGLFVLFAAVIDQCRLWVARRRAWLSAVALVPVVIVVLTPRHEIENIRLQAQWHLRLHLMGAYLREALPPNAVILTYAHGGALSLYTARPIVRLDMIEPGALDGVVSDLLEGAYRPVFVLDMAVEHARFVDRFKGSRYIALDWPARAEFASELSVLYVDAADRESFVNGDRWPVDLVLSPERHGYRPQWPYLRVPQERFVLASPGDAWAFRTALEATYAGVLRRQASATALDAHEAVSWLRRYLRYRVHGCDHQDAAGKVFKQFTVGGEQPLCRPTRVIVFPPRNETVAFRRDLETWSSERGTRGGQSFVDLEGEAVWLQEYLSLRANGCGHEEATSKVTAEIVGRASRSACAAPNSSSP
jgi:hypothetical protein